MKIMMRLTNRFLPSCEEVSHLTSQEMDESLPWRQRLRLRLHLRMCVWCRRNAEQLQLMKDMARGQAVSQDKQIKLSSDARKRISRSIEKKKDQS